MIWLDQVLEKRKKNLENNQKNENINKPLAHTVQDARYSELAASIFLVI